MISAERVGSLMVSAEAVGRIMVSAGDVIALLAAMMASVRDVTMGVTRDSVTRDIVTMDSVTRDSVTTRSAMITIAGMMTTEKA